MQDWQKKLSKDPQGRADNKAFAPREQQTLFEKYVKNLAVHIERDFRTLMEQVQPQAQVYNCAVCSCISVGFCHIQGPACPAIISHLGCAYTLSLLPDEARGKSTMSTCA